MKMKAYSLNNFLSLYISLSHIHTHTHTHTDLKDFISMLKTVYSAITQVKGVIDMHTAKYCQINTPIKYFQVTLLLMVPHS